MVQKKNSKTKYLLFSDLANFFCQVAFPKLNTTATIATMPELSAAHAAPLAVAVSSAFVMLWAGFKVGKARKKYNVKYPAL